MDPSRAATYAHEGKCLEDLHKYDEQITLYGKAIELEPKNAMWQRYVAGCLFEQGKWDEAAAHYEKASQLDPKDYHALNWLALCYEITDRERDAKKVRRQSERIPGEKENMRKSLDKIRAELAKPDASSPATNNSSPIIIHLGE